MAKKKQMGKKDERGKPLKRYPEYYGDVYIDPYTGVARSAPRPLRMSRKLGYD